MSRELPTQSLIRADGIREDVLRQHLWPFFGPKATLEATRTKDGSPAYLIKSQGIKVTPAIVEDLREASRRADENDRKSLYKTPSNSNPSLNYGPPAEQGPYTPRRHDSHVARSDSRRYDSDASPAFGPPAAQGTLSSRDMKAREDISGASTPFGFDEKEVTTARKDFHLFGEEENDSLQSKQIRRPPRVDSIQSFAKDSRSYHPSGGVDSKRGTSAVPTRQARQDVEDQYQRNPESQYDSRFQQRADPEARHKPELSQQRQPDIPSQAPQASYLSPSHPQESYATPYLSQRADPEARHKPELSQQRQLDIPSQAPQASYLSPSRPQEPYAAQHSSPAYFPGQKKTQGDFKEFKEWQIYLRQREAYERERHAKSHARKYDDQHETPLPRPSEIDPQQHKPRQPSPGTYGQQRTEQQRPEQQRPEQWNLDTYDPHHLPKRNLDPHGQPRSGEGKHYR